MGCHNQKGQQIQTEEIQNAKENDMQAEEKLSDDHNAIRTRVLKALLEIQNMDDGHQSQIKAAMYRIATSSAGRLATHSAPYQTGPCNKN